MNESFDVRREKYLKLLFVISVLAILFATLWPFNPWPRNQATWLRDGHGIVFGKPGSSSASRHCRSKTPKNPTDFRGVTQAHVEIGPGGIYRQSKIRERPVAKYRGVRSRWIRLLRLFFANPKSPHRDSVCHPCRSGSQSHRRGTSNLHPAARLRVHRCHHQCVGNGYWRRTCATGPDSSDSLEGNGAIFEEIWVKTD
jgi:hypothetical protein